MAIGAQSSNLPTIQRFDAGDYPKSSKEFQTFLSTLNLFTQPVYNLLNAALDITQNTKEEIYTFSITAGASATSNTYTFTPRKFAGRPNGVVIGQCLLSASTPTAIGNPVTLDWSWTGSQIQILAIYGLTNGSTYSFSVRIY
jgi:hypothetical protein